VNLRDGQPGLDVVRAALGRGIACVLANKGPLALAYAELARMSDLATWELGDVPDQLPALRFSACVGGAMPSINVGWRDMLGCSEATVTDRKYLGLYRYAAYFHEVLERVQPHAAAIALATRRFSPGDPDDRRALSATRAALGQPELALSAWRSSYREGATRSLTLLGAPEALGPEVMAEVGAAFRRVLRVD